MKEDNTPTVNKKTRTPSRKLRLRLETAKALKGLNKRSKTVRQRKKEAKANAKQPDPENHLSISRIPRIRKNKLVEPPRAISRYKRRQVSKTWLPTHMWHTKRAHMTRPTEPLWRMAIPLSPTEKSYRPSHRAAGSRGCIAWDKSYMSTVGCKGTHASLESMLKALGFHGEGWSGARHKRWRAGTRFASGFLSERDGIKRVISPVSIVWCVKEVTPEQTCEANLSGDISMPDVSSEASKRKTRLDRRLFIRVHPSAFQHFWLELLKVAKMQKPQVLVEDLRFEIGSIEVVGPDSTEALAGVLRPFHGSNHAVESAEEVWTSLVGLSNPASLPEGALLSFNIQDPRLNHPPRQVKRDLNEASLARLNELAALWPLDTTLAPSRLYSQKPRWLASQSLPSQQAINRRKAETTSGQTIVPTEKDPHIPLLLLATRPASRTNNVQGSWIVLMPWRCVDAVWRSLMYYPLSSGGTPRFGCLREEQQIAFEQLAPWYPGDYPGTEAGKAWERTESENRFDEWLRRPPSRRLAWDMVDLGLGRKGEIGRGWACDWEFLFAASIGEDAAVPAISSTIGPAIPAMSPDQTSKILAQKQRKAEHAANRTEGTQRRRNTSSPESDDETTTMEYRSDQLRECPDFIQIPSKQALALIKSSYSVCMPATPALMTMQITLLSRGTPSPAARIYRLPRPAKPAPAQSQSSALGASVASSERSAPPPAQHSPPTPATTTPSPAETDLCARWLALADSHTSTSTQAEDQPKLKKDKINHRSLPRKSHHHPRESLEHINVLPKNAPPEVVEQYGAKAKNEEEIAAEERKRLMTELMKGDVVGGEWDKHIPCPDVGDLIGFVTSGNYNLSEGRGTAVGSLWLQKVAAGWQAEEAESLLVINENGTRSQPLLSTGRSIQQDRLLKRRERERHLCIVRNAGESVGRLGIWNLSG